MWNKVTKPQKKKKKEHHHFLFQRASSFAFLTLKKKEEKLKIIASGSNSIMNSKIFEVKNLLRTAEVIWFVQPEEEKKFRECLDDARSYMV